MGSEFISVSTISDSIKEFKNATHEINTYNEIDQLNEYLFRVKTTESSRLNRVNETLKGSIIKAKQDYMMADRTINLLKFKSGLLYLSLIVMCIVLMIVGMQLLKFAPFTNAVVSGTIITIVLTMYLLITLFYMFNNSSRKNTNWNQYYWQPM